MLSVLTTAGLMLLGYLSGSVPFGYMAGRLRGIDIRQHGSGNIGATNAIRVLGKSLGVPVFILDMAKGALPVMAAWALCGSRTAPLSPAACQLAAVLTGISAVLGHNYTCWLGFRGGKGIATSAGVLLALAPWTLLTTLLVWLVTFFTTRYVSVASIAAGVALPVAVTVAGWLRGAFNVPLLVLSLIIGFLAVWRHRSNIQRLREGTESRSLQKKPKSHEPPPHSRPS